MAVTSRRSSRAKSASVSTLTGIDWDSIKATVDLTGSTVHPPPSDEWQTQAQLRERWGTKEAVTKRTVRILLADGVIEKQNFGTRSIDGRMVPVPHYRIIK